MPGPALLDLIGERVLVFDGAMGTMLHAAGPAPEDWMGRENCSEVLNLSRPDVVAGVHRAYLEAGADVIETNTFGGSALVLGEFGLDDRVEEINRLAVEIARREARAFSTPERPRFVAASVGPGTKLPSLGHTDWAALHASYLRQVRGLLDGGPDVILVETAQDPLQVKAALAAIDDALGERGLDLPVMVQVTIESTGTMLVGTDIAAATAALARLPRVRLLGMNCATGPAEMAEHVRHLARHSPVPVSVLPNAGLPELVDGRPRYPLTPEELADWHERFVAEDGVAVVGGCCGTTPAHIRAVVERVGGRRPAARKPVVVPAITSLYGAVDLRQEADVLAVGERTNANGSRRFKKLLLAEDWDGIVEMGRRQVAAGSHAIDVCTALVGRDERADMVEVVGRFRTRVDAPLVIDSTDEAVIRAALEMLGGRSVINSINLEEGEERARRLCRLARRHGAALVALTIDEAGMARTPERKLAVAERLAALAAEQGLDESDLLFDPLTFTVCTGQEEDRKLALHTLDGIEAIARRFPRAGILLGVSNVSFGLKPPARHVLNSVMLFHARQRGLTAAILHASRIAPLHRIPEEQRQVAEDLIFDRRRPGYDPLTRFIELFAEAAGSAEATPARAPAVSVEDRLRRRIVDGDRAGLEADLDEALTRMAPLAIVNEVLLDGMREVGELFGSGRMQLPFVLQSAETMKAAVRHLEPHIRRAERDRGEAARRKGRLVLATVRGDVHDIGKNLVDIILSNNGYEVVNLGIKQPVEAILRAAVEHEADAIGMSGLLVKSTAIMRDNLVYLRERGVRIPVILGGAALTRSFVEKDCTAAYGQRVAYGRDAFSGLAFMEEVVRARDEGVPCTWTEPLDAGPAEAPTAAGGGRRPLPEAEPSPPAPEPVPPPTPPFWGSRVVESVPLAELRPLLDEDVLFKFQWGFLRKNLSREAHAEQLRTVARPALEALLARCEAEAILQPRAAWGWFRCRRDGDALRVERPGGGELRLAFPRQRFADGRAGLCLADYFREDGDVVGFLAVTAGERASEVARAWFEADAYRDYLFLHGLSVEITEALAEWAHREMRRELGIDGDDAPDPRDLLRARYRGRRYAYGYPACPDLADQRHLLDLLGADRIGVRMDADEQLHPEQSTAAIVVHHPAARYFRA